LQGPDKELLKPQTINLSKDYSFVENELLAKEHEADILTPPDGARARRDRHAAPDEPEVVRGD